MAPRDTLAAHLVEIFGSEIPLSPGNIDALINTFYGRGAVNTTGRFTPMEITMMKMHFNVYRGSDGTIDPQAATDINRYLRGLGRSETFDLGAELTGGPTDPKFAVPIPEPIADLPSEPVDFYSEAIRLFPEIPGPLIDTFVDEWSRWGPGGEGLAWRAVRDDPLYEQYFPGNLRPDGTPRMSEAQYAATMEGYKEVLRGVDINPSDPIIPRDRLVQLIQGDVSVDEFYDRVALMHRRVVMRAPEVQRLFAEHRGIGVSPHALLAVSLNPDLNDALLNEEIDIAQIRASAERHGFNLGFSGVQGFVRRGLDVQTASRQLAAAAGVMPALSGAARRQGVDVGVTDFLNAGLGDADPIRTINRVTATELASNIRGVRFGAHQRVR